MGEIRTLSIDLVYYPVYFERLWIVFYSAGQSMPQSETLCSVTYFYWHNSLPGTFISSVLSMGIDRITDTGTTLKILR
jgi:hypothetical protein